MTCVHKANIMKLGDGLFLRCCEEVSVDLKHLKIFRSGPFQVAELYPNIVFEKMIVDNTCMQIVSKPQQFDVMVSTISHSTPYQPR